MCALLFMNAAVIVTLDRADDDAPPGGGVMDPVMNGFTRETLADRMDDAPATAPAPVDIIVGVPDRDPGADDR
jgi:hypothetical protein